MPKDIAPDLRHLIDHNTYADEAATVAKLREQLARFRVVAQRVAKRERVGVAQLAPLDVIEHADQDRHLDHAGRREKFVRSYFRRSARLEVAHVDTLAATVGLAPVGEERDAQRTIS